MKLNSYNRQRGGTLLVVLFISLSVGIVLATYLSVVSSRHKISVRSMDWNTTIPVLEAGVEEAMTHLNDDTSPSANSWTQGTIGGQTVYTKTRYFSDGSYYYVTIYNATTAYPSIYSTGFVPSPLKANTYISRTVRVGATNPPTIFRGALATTGTITLQGSATIDGFDSRIGRYDTTTNRAATGGVASDSNGNPAINLQTARVFGPVTSGPNGTLAVSGSGGAGDVSWLTNGSNTGFEQGWTNNNMNVAFPSNSPPSNLASYTAKAFTAGVTNYLGNGNYSATSFTSSQSTSPLFITGNATLYLSGNLTVQGSGYIYIQPGASLTIYVAGSTTTVSGSGVVNGNADATTFTYKGLSSNTRADFTGSSDFYGTVNAPQAAVTVSGAANAYGAIIASTATVSGKFHYDAAVGAGNSLVATSWTEL